MDTEKEEQAAEQEATREIKEDEVRAKIIAEYGFDEVDDEERIAKLVTKEIEHTKKLNTAIGQKIKHRTEAQTAKDELAKVAKPPAETKTGPEDVSKAVATELEKRDLEALEYPDDIKKEVQRIAQIQGVSIKTATRDPYITAKVEAWEKVQKQDEAAISRTNRSSGKKSYSLSGPPESVDMSTAEGRKEYDEWIAWAKKNGG